MDETTEPIIAVIGHPIAGNPTQFAIEMALHSRKLDWRVLSFDVQPTDIATALDGFAVLGFAGVIIDPSVCDEASAWYAANSDDRLESDETNRGDETGDKTESPEAEAVAAADDPNRIDCLHRNAEAKFVGSYEQRAWVDDAIAGHAAENRILLGESLHELPLSRDSLAVNPVELPPDPEVIGAAKVIILADQGDIALEVEDWPANDGSTLIIDLSNGHVDQPTMQRLGYHVVTEMERRIGMLQRCLHRWTGEHVSADVIHDAIEEYLGV